MAAINELINPIWNGSGLLNVLIAASGAEFRARNFKSIVEGNPLDSYPEVLDYSLLLKNASGTTTLVREFDDSWHDATTETYIDMPENYRGMFSGIREYVQNISGSILDSRIPLTYVSGTVANTEIITLFHGALTRSVSKIKTLGSKKKFIGGMNFVGISGIEIEDYNFIGGNGPTNLLYDSTYNFMALPELILAFETINPSGVGVSLEANPPLDLLDDNILTPTTFGWISYLIPAVGFTASVTADVLLDELVNISFSLSDISSIQAAYFMVIPFLIQSGAIHNFNINSTIQFTPIGTTSFGSILGISPVTDSEDVHDISIDIYDSDFNFENNLFDDDETDSGGDFNDGNQHSFITNIPITGDGLLHFIVVSRSMTRTNNITYTNFDAGPNDALFFTYSGAIVAYAGNATMPNSLCDDNFMGNILFNNQPIIWSGFIDGSQSQISGVIFNYSV